MRTYAIEAIMAVNWSQPSLDGMSIPVHWFRLQPHVSDSALSWTLNRAKAGNLLLGNREPNEHGGQYKLCPLCRVQGLLVPLKEAHVLLSCPTVAFERGASGLQHYIQTKLASLPAKEVLWLYLGGDGVTVQGLVQRS